MSDENTISRAEYDAMTQRATAAEDYSCRTAVEQAAIRLGCPPGHAPVVADVLASRVRMVDGRPQYIETRTADDGQPVDVHHPVDHGVGVFAREHSYIFRRGEPQLPAGDIDVSKLSGEEFAKLRRMPGGRAKLGLE